MLGEEGIIIGQILSMVAVVTGFVSFQMKTPKGILSFQIITALIFSAHYFLIGAMTATVLNLIGTLQCVCYYLRDKRGSKSPVLPAFFTALVICTSILTWDGWYSAFIMAGLIINAIALSVPDAQRIRALTLIKSPLCLAYNICVLSTGGILFESAVTVSSVIGLIRAHRPTKKEASAEGDTPA